MMPTLSSLVPLEFRTTNHAVNRRRANYFNTLKPLDDTGNCIFMNKNCCILIEISLKLVHKGSIDSKPSMVQIMAWQQLSEKLWSEPNFSRRMYVELSLDG